MSKKDIYRPIYDENGEQIDADYDGYEEIEEIPEPEDPFDYNH